MIDNILKWSATIILIIGTGFTSLGFYPLGPMISSLGGIFWLIVSIRWRETSMIVTNLVMTLTAILGLFIHYYLI